MVVEFYLFWFMMIVSFGLSLYWLHNAMVLYKHGAISKQKALSGTLLPLIMLFVIILSIVTHKVPLSPSEAVRRSMHGR